jgi:hypothetical protein
MGSSQQNLEQQRKLLTGIRERPIRNTYLVLGMIRFRENDIQQRGTENQAWGTERGKGRWTWWAIPGVRGAAGFIRAISAQDLHADCCLENRMGK